MQHFNYIILGAGPAGLAFAHTLKSRGENSFLVLEKESVAGGLCRSAAVDGAPLDIGGGHFLDEKRQEVLELLFRFMPRHEWRRHERISRINLRGTAVDHPLEANIWQLPLQDQIDFLESIAQAGNVRCLTMPDTFVDWISWKLGERIAAEYMLPYNRKMWGDYFSELGLYWLYKLPAVSFRETLQSCLEKRPFGELPAHGTFLYPQEFGYGEVWRRMGLALKEQLMTDIPLQNVHIEKKIINGQFTAETIISTIPWPEWLSVAELPQTVAAQIHKLRNVSIDVDYYDKTLPTDAHWLYEPAEHLSYHRILCRGNFCVGSRGYWTETNTKRAVVHDGWRYRNDYAYPVNTLDKPAAIAAIRQWGETRGIIGLGRWGAWEHMNSDVAVEQGMALAKRLLQHRSGSL